MNLYRIASDLERDGYDSEEAEAIIDRMAEDAIDDARDRDLEEKQS